MTTTPQDDNEIGPQLKGSSGAPRSVFGKSWMPSMPSDDPKMEQRRRRGLFSFAFFTVSMSAGLVYGWPSLRRNLVNAEGSTIDEKTLGLIFTLSSWSTQGGRFLFGLARDHCLGTRLAATLSLLCTTIGCLGIALTDAESGTIIAISMFLVGLGSGNQLCLQPVANLFDENMQGTVILSLSGAFQISGLLFLMLTAITKDRRKSFGALSFCLFLCTIASAQILPRHQFKRKEEEVVEGKDLPNLKKELELTTASNAAKHEDDIEILLNTNTHGKKAASLTYGPDVEVQNSRNAEDGSVNVHMDSNVVPSDEKTLASLLCSLEYLLLVSWFSLLILPCQYYVATIGFQLERKGDDSGTYTALFSILYAGAAVVAPISGKTADVFGLGVTQAIATTLVALSLFILASDKWSLKVQAVGLACYGVGRLCVFGMFFANVGKRFGYKYYGTLGGSGLMLSAIVSFAQYPLISLAVDGKESIVNNVCAAIVLLLGVPYCFWLGLRERFGD